MQKKMFAGAEKSLFEKAHKMRNQPTFAEEIVWNYLRTKPKGYKFRRQHPYLHYILDFYCHQLKLVIEADGSIHDVAVVKRNDEQRQMHLEDDGLTVLRFTNDEIKSEPNVVFEKIEAHLKSKSKIE